MNLKALITEPKNFCSHARVILEGCCDVTDVNESLPNPFQTLKDQDVLVVRLNYNIDRDFIDRAVRLKYIVSPTTGLNHIDVEYALQKGVCVLSLRGESEFLKSITATAELSWALILCLARRVPEAVDSVHNGIWDRDLFVGSELKSKLLGVMGFGRLGKIVVRYAKAFGMKILACDPYVKIDDPDVQQVNQQQLFSEADIITVHVNYSSETRGLIGMNDFRRMKKGSYFVNTSRGEIVDEHALVEALNEGVLSGAATDVLAYENLFHQNGEIVENLLWKYASKHKNLLITPHIGGATLESMHATEIFMMNKLKEKLIKDSLFHIE